MDRSEYQSTIRSLQFKIQHVLAYGWSLHCISSEWPWFSFLKRNSCIVYWIQFIGMLFLGHWISLSRVICVSWSAVRFAELKWGSWWSRPQWSFAWFRILLANVLWRSCCIEVFFDWRRYDGSYLPNLILPAICWERCNSGQVERRTWCHGVVYRDWRGLSGCRIAKSPSSCICTMNFSILNEQGWRFMFMEHIPYSIKGNLITSYSILEVEETRTL